MRQNILLLSAGRRVELLQGIKAAQSRMVPSARVIAADMRPELSAACQSADEYAILPAVSEDGYATALDKLCDCLSIGLVIPTIDTELMKLSQLRAAFECCGTHIIVSDEALITLCRDKRSTSELFHKLGIAAPKIYSPDTVRLPCFSKPYDGSSGKGAFRIDNVAALTADLFADPKRIFMELVPPNYREITIDLYYDRHSVLKAIVPRERLEVRAGEVSKGVTRRDWVYAYLFERVRFVDGARGCLTLQLFASPDEESVYAIEINPRFGGGFPLSLAAGADFPEWLIREYLLGKDVAFFEEWEPDLMMLRYDAKVLVHNHG